MANAQKMLFGSPTTVINVTSDITNNNIAGGTAELDNSTNLYPYARAVFNNPNTFAAAPTDKSVVNLWAVLQDVDGTSDDTATPTGTDVESARFMGAFPIYDADEEQRVTIDISLLGITKALFYIENKTGQTITGSGGNIYVKVTPYTIESAA